MHLELAFFIGHKSRSSCGNRRSARSPRSRLRDTAGCRACDDAAIVAVTDALGGHLPVGASGRGGDVRTRWQREATADVVVSLNPELVFDESSGKRERSYPLPKEVDHHVRSMARY